MTYDFDEAVRVEQQRGSTVTRYPDGYRISNPILGAHEMHYQCLPDTVDPRGRREGRDEGDGSCCALLARYSLLGLR
jgi:hypothetical protein